MTSMCQSNEQDKVANFSMKNKHLGVDPESRPPRDHVAECRPKTHVTADISSTSPLQLLPTLRFRPTILNPPPVPLKRRRPSARCLQHGLQQHSSWAKSSPDDDERGGVVTDTAAKSSLNEARHAPLADGVHLSEDGKREPHPQPNRASGGKKGRRSGSGRRRSCWVTFKTVSRMSLVLGVGVAVVDLYLVCWSSRAVSRGGLNPIFGAALPAPARESRGRSNTGITSFLFGDFGRKKYFDDHPRFGGAFGGPRPSKPSSVRDTINALSGHEGATESGFDRTPSFWTKGLGIGQQNQRLQHQRQLRTDLHDGPKIAVVVPYARTELPVWWDVFAEHASFNGGLVDWLIFCDQKLVRKDGPSNIKFVPTNTSHMAWLLAGVVEQDDQTTIHRSGGGGGGGGGVFRSVVPKKPRARRRGEKPGEGAGHESGMQESSNVRGYRPAETVLIERQKVASRLHQLLLTTPGCVADFKPAFGWLFREYLEGYTHWAFGELDVLFGNMSNGWLGPDELREFDIITFSRGDQHRAYMRGQLTVHKNTAVVNRVWRRCPHLSNYSKRLEAFRDGHERPLESAKDCYGRAVALDPSLRVAFAVKAIPGTLNGDEGPVAPWGGREVIIGGRGLVTLCPDLGHYADSSGSIYGVATAGNEARDKTTPTMQDAVGPATRVRQAQVSEKCEHGMELEHQTCVQGVGPTHTLFLVNGEYWKQEFINTAAATNGGHDCLGGAFYEFKEHKRNYRGWNTRPPVQPAHFGVAVGPGGIVPLPAAGWRERSAGTGLPPSTEHTAKIKWYCLKWTERLQSRGQGIARAEQVCTVKVSSEEVDVVVDTRLTPKEIGDVSAGAVRAETISMGSVGEPKDLETFKSNAERWEEGPKIFTMALDDEELAATRSMEILRGLESIRGVLIVVLPRPSSSPPPPPPNLDATKSKAKLPGKALMNLVSDLCESRYLFMLPESSLLDRHTSETVAARLLDHRSAPASSKARWPSSSPKPAAKGSSSPEARASGIPGPVTLVVPLVTADGDEGRVASDAADTGGGGGAGEESNLGVSSWMRQRGLKDVGTADSRADAAAERKGTGSKPPVGEGIAAAPLRMSFVRPVGGGWPADLAIGRARKLDTRAGNANTKRVGMNERAADENSGQERERDATAIADRREAEWIRNVLMSGPTVPGLVVDLWSPGAMFLRHVEEFGDSGCMDAGYALGLWAAGSNFELVDATLRSSALPSTGNLYSKDSSAFQPAESESEMRIPGGSCLRSDAVANTASIYSTFLSQVSNVYRHSQSGIAGRKEGRRRYQDHWEHLEEETANDNASDG